MSFYILEIDHWLKNSLREEYRDSGIPSRYTAYMLYGFIVVCSTVDCY